jgi:hypothetical protein
MAVVNLLGGVKCQGKYLFQEFFDFEGKKFQLVVLQRYVAKDSHLAVTAVVVDPGNLTRGQSGVVWCPESYLHADANGKLFCPDKGYTGGKVNLTGNSTTTPSGYRVNKYVKEVENGSFHVTYKAELSLEDLKALLTK